MLIKHYVVTYNNPIFAECVRSILACPTHHAREIWIINNHSNFVLPDDLAGKVGVLHNQTRPDFSTGHLSRNWNQALIHGFVNLNAPQADLLVLSQNDTEFVPDYVDRLLGHHERFDLVTYGGGDNAVSYAPRAVRRVGLWDERFCNIGYQEGDYFLRAVKFLGDRCSINDGYHWREHNVVPDLIVKDLVSGHNRGDEAHMASKVHHPHSEKIFKAKWRTAHPLHWNPNNHPSNAVQLIDSYIYYPYFEKAVETLGEQRYVV